MTIKAPEVYRTLRQELGPWFKAEGFRRTKGGMLGWHRPQGPLFLVVGFYCWPPPGGDPLYGSCYTVQFELSESPLIGTGRTHIARLNNLLSEAQFDRLLEIQNAVIAKLKKPDKGHYIFQLPKVLIDNYLSEFEPLTRDNIHWYNQWLRYRDVEDVRHWAHFVVSHLPYLIHDFISSETAV
jgi:hypothetical protein